MGAKKPTDMERDLMAQNPGLTLQDVRDLITPITSKDLEPEPSLDSIIKRVQAVIDETQDDAVSEVTLAGNGVNSCEAGHTLKWVMNLLKGKKTQP